MQKTVVERSLYLLSAVYEKDINVIAGLSVGQRDAGLLQFREWIFGPRLLNVSRCPNCSTPIEWESDVRDLLLQQLDPDSDAKIINLEKGRLNIEFRLPNSLDIMEAFSDPELAGDPVKFLSNCIIRVRDNARETGVETLSPEMFSMIEQRMSDEDPQADIKMVLNCPECGTQWEAPFDIMSYLWQEIDNWAKRLLGEVALLARAFGWSEKEILGLSHQRRKLYMEMIT